MPWSAAPQVQNEAESGLSDPAPPIANPMTAAPLVPQIIQPIADSTRTEAMLTVMAARRAVAAYLRHVFGAALRWETTAHNHFPASPSHSS